MVAEGLENRGYISGITIVGVAMLEEVEMVAAPVENASVEVAAGISPGINNGPARIKVPIFFSVLSSAHGRIISEVVGRIPEKPLMLWNGSTKAPNTRNLR